MKFKLKDYIKKQKEEEKRKKNERKEEELYWEFVYLNMFDPYDEAGDRE